MDNGRDHYSNFSGDSCSLLWPEMDFEGVFTESYPDGQLRYRGAFLKNRMRMGQHLLFWNNGVLREVSHWDEGWVCGILLRFDEQGNKELEVYYGPDGGKTRSWVECHFSDRQVCTPFLIRVCENDEFVREWVDPILDEILPKDVQDKIMAEVLKKHYPELF